MTTSNAAPMVRVPVEPTQAMLKAAHATMLSDIPPDGESAYGPTVSTHAIYRAYWAAMLSAAPSASTSCNDIAVHCQQDGCQFYKHPPECWHPPAESQPQGVEAVGFRYRIAPSDECRSRPWAGAGIVAEWGKPAPPDNSTIQYQTLYAPAAQIAAPGDPWPTTEADEAAMALAAEDMGNPAWWRGHDEACTILCQKVNAILDGNDDGRGVANDPWESTRRRLLALVAAPGDVEERARELLDAECIKRAPRSSALVSVSTALRAISAALRSQEPAYGPDGSMSIHCQQDGCQMYKHPPECWSQGQAVAVDDAMRRELKRDAERYRWLRDESGNDIAAPFVCGVHGAPMGDAGWLTGDLLDAAIDAAMNGANT